MRFVMYILLVLIFVQLSNATRQSPDVIIVNQDTLPLYSFPLTRKINIMSNRPKFWKFGGGGTNCFRGYIATWEIDHDSLFLNNVATCHSLSWSLNDSLLRQISEDEILAPFYDTLVTLKGIEYSFKQFELALINILGRKLYKKHFQNYMHSRNIRTGNWNYQYHFDVGLLLSSKKLAPRPKNAPRYFFPWYSGVLETPLGDQISRGDFWTFDEHESYKFIFIESGKVIKTEEVVNDSGVTVYLRFGEPRWNKMNKKEIAKCLRNMVYVSTRWSEESEKYGLRQLRDCLMYDTKIFLRGMNHIKEKRYVKIYPLIKKVELSENDRVKLIEKFENTRRNKKIKEKVIQALQNKIE